jgi:hypothetical protein
MNGNEPMQPDWILETDDSIRARLEAAKEAQSRTRITLVAMAIASIMMLVTGYNAYLSYDFEWARSVIGQRFDVTRTTDRVLTEHGLKLWAEARNVYVPLFGIRVSVDDTAVLGTGTLVVLALWLMLSTRRENQTIGFLLRDTESAPSQGQPLERRRYAREHRWWIFHTVIANSIYYCISCSFRPIDKLTGPNQASEDQLTLGQRQQCAMVISWIERFFFLFPVIVSLFVFGLDRCSYYWTDPFMPGGNPQGAQGVYYWASFVMFPILWIPLLILCRKARRFSQATHALIGEYFEVILRDIAEGQRELMDSRGSPAAGQGK